MPVGDELAGPRARQAQQPGEGAVDALAGEALRDLDDLVLETFGGHDFTCRVPSRLTPRHVRQTMMTAATVSAMSATLPTNTP